MSLTQLDKLDEIMFEPSPARLQEMLAALSVAELVALHDQALSLASKQLTIAAEIAYLLARKKPNG